MGGTVFLALGTTFLGVAGGALLTGLTAFTLGDGVTPSKRLRARACPPNFVRQFGFEYLVTLDCFEIKPAGQVA